MVTQPVTVEKVLELIRQLSPRERLRVLARALPELERELPATPQPRKSLLGLCTDLGPAPSAEEIDEARREAWAGFPW
jgi:hypothetical protein